MSLPRRPREPQKQGGSGWGGADWLELIFDGVEPMFYVLRFAGHLLVVALHVVFHL